MIELQHLTKRFDTKAGKFVALKDISLTIQDGDIYGIIGMSGAGKSTLVRCINMLEKPDEGSVIVNGRKMETLDARELRQARREIAMIFQQFNLLMQRSCLKNVCFPMELAGVPKEKAKPGPGNCWNWWACLIRQTATRPSFPAARSSAWPSPAPWPPIPRCCCATKPPARWTPTPPMPSCS